MKKISLYGNVFIDTLLCVDGQFEINASNNLSSVRLSVGGIGNCVRFLRKVFPDIAVGVNTSVGEHEESNQFVLDFLLKHTNDISISSADGTVPNATIIVDRCNNTRTSVVAWGDCINHRITPQVADWHHIVYADSLKQLTADNVRQLDGIVSIDLCMSQYTEEEKKRLWGIVREVDYVIISDVEASALSPNDYRLIGETCKKGAIIHVPEGSMFIDRYSTIETKCKKHPNINVLGAGDFFASTFIALQLLGFTIEKTMDNIHDVVSDYLQNCND